MTHRLGIDVGGTFTDLLLIRDGDRRTWRAKVPSTPDDQSRGVLAGIERICTQAKIGPDAISALLHGTTVATNAVLEGKGARVGLVVTQGYRQVLHIARSFVPGGLAGWIVWQRKPELARLEDTFEVVERIGSDGRVVCGLDEGSVRAAAAHLRASGVDAVTVSLINSFANDAHERQVGALLAQELPGIPISLSADILPEMREYERTVTTVANAYVQPTVRRYLGNLESACAERGVGARLRVLRSDGGLMAFSSAAHAPVNLLMSGPAGGVAGAIWAARQAGHQNLLTFDMGGTSTDVALVEDGKPRLRRETAVGDVTVRASSLDVRTVGAGGGSIARVPELTRALRVGPQSAGAEPGPAAYGHGGEEPTVTDANVVLGYLPSGLLGGSMPLDRAAAERAVSQVAQTLGIDVVAAAQGIVDIVNEAMFGALRLVSIEQGYDPRDFALVAFGGAGPLHANALGRLLGSWPVVIPPSPGVLCAYGDATTRLRGEAGRTFMRRVGETSTADVNEAFSALRERAGKALATDGVPLAEQTTHYAADLRYHGQGMEIPVAMEAAELDGDALGLLTARFDAAHERLYTFALDAEREIVNLRVVVEGPLPTLDTSRLGAAGADPAVARTGEVTIHSSGQALAAGVYDRARLLAGHRIVGPAIVTEMDSTTLVLPGHAATVDPSGCLLIRPL